MAGRGDSAGTAVAPGSRKRELMISTTLRQRWSPSALPRGDRYRSGAGRAPVRELVRTGGNAGAPRAGTQSTSRWSPDTIHREGFRREGEENSGNIGTARTEGGAKTSPPAARRPAVRRAGATEEAVRADEADSTKRHRVRRRTGDTGEKWRRPTGCCARPAIRPRTRPTRLELPGTKQRQSSHQPLVP